METEKKRGRGRPRKPDGTKSVKVGVSIDYDLVEKFKLLGGSTWLNRKIRAAKLI